MDMILNLFKLIAINLLLVVCCKQADAQEHVILWKIENDILYLDVKPKINGPWPAPPPKPIDPGLIESVTNYLRGYEFKIIKKEKILLLIISAQKGSQVKFSKQLIETKAGYVLPKNSFETVNSYKKNNKVNKYSKDDKKGEDNFLQMTKLIFEDRVFPIK